jgi:hypothetical protein
MLAVAAADTDDGIGIGLAAAANDGTVFLIRHGSDGTGINDIGIAAFVKMADFMPHLGQKPLHGLCFVLICLASKGIKGESHC